MTRMRYAVSQPASLRLPMRLGFFVVSTSRGFRAIRRSSAKLPGAFCFRERERSSLNVMSSIQCCWFSIPQGQRIAAASSVACGGGHEMK